MLRVKCKNVFEIISNNQTLTYYPCECDKNNYDEDYLKLWEQMENGINTILNFTDPDGISSYIILQDNELIFQTEHLDNSGHNLIFMPFNQKLIKDIKLLLQKWKLL
jgi:hypothetical protein